MGTPEEVAAVVVFSVVAGGFLRHAAGHRGERRVVLMRRVVVTGHGGVSALGSEWAAIEAAFRAQRNCDPRHAGVGAHTRDLNTRIGGANRRFAAAGPWSRKQLRSMGRVSQFAVRAAELALDDAGVLSEPVIRSGAIGVACGSSTGSTPDIKDFAAMLITGDSRGAERELPTCA